MRIDKDGEEAANIMNLKKKSYCLEIYKQIVCLTLVTPEIRLLILPSSCYKFSFKLGLRILF